MVPRDRVETRMEGTCNSRDDSGTETFHSSTVFTKDSGNGSGGFRRKTKLLTGDTMKSPVKCL